MHITKRNLSEIIEIFINSYNLSRRSLLTVNSAMIRVARLHRNNFGLRLLSLNSKWSKPFDFSNINSHKSSESFDLESLLARGARDEGPKKPHLIDGSNNSSGANNRFAQMFDKSSQIKNRTAHKSERLEGHENTREFNQKHNNKKHRNQRNSGDRRNLDTKKPHRKALRFQITTGSDQAQNAVKDLISKVHIASKSYRVKFVNPENNKLEQKHLVEIVNNVDLAETGLYMVPPSKEGEIPLIKTNKVFEMIKQYTDDLATKREKELLEKGSIAAQKAVRQRDRAEKKKSATKILTLSWKISLSDLNNQKKMEIKRRINKGEKFILYMGDRRSLYAARKSVDKEGGIMENIKGRSGVNNASEEEFDEINDNDPSEIDFEIKRRQMIIEELTCILEECSCQFDISGHVDSRIMVSCSPPVIKEKTCEPTVDVSQKDIKKQKKILKLKKLEEERQQKKAKVDEDELDSLYLFKLED